MEFVRPKDIKFQWYLGKEKFNINGIAQPIVFKEAEVNLQDFSQIISAETPDKLLGYAGISSRQRLLLDVAPNLIELRMLKVDPNYFGKGIASGLIRRSFEFAKSRHKKLILFPERPGDYLRSEFRDVEYPLTTEQLKKM